MVQVLNCGNLDISQISEEAVAMGQSAWIAADVDEKIYTFSKNYNDPDEPLYAYIVIKFSSPCLATICDDSSTKGLQWALSTQEVLYDNLEDFRDFAIDSTEEYTDTVNDALANFGKSSADQFHFSPSWKTQRAIPFLDNRIVKDLTTQSTKGIDAHNLNDFGFQSVAVRPLGAVIPLRHNFDTYGPWTSNNFWNSYGGIDVKNDPSFAPWFFGSMQVLNEAGENIVEFSNRGLVKAESGSVTLVGIPSSTHNLPRLGEKLSSAGPNLTSVNFSLGTKGATTTYEFKTYTPKFGRLTKLFYDRYKELHKARNKQLRLLKDFQSKQNKLFRKIAARRSREKIDTVKSDALSNSMQRVIIGYMDDWYNLEGETSKKTVVGIATLAKTSLETFDGSKGIMSLDGIFSPIGQAGAPVSTPEDPSIAMTWPGMPPSIDGPNIINGESYNPFFGGGGDGPAKYHNGEAMGHSIDIVGGGGGNNGLIKSFYAADDPDKYFGSSSIALKGPLMLHSWGYDLEGNPVPGDGTNFEPNWLQKPHKWPVAPVDLRFDKQRGMWVAPQPFRIVVGRLVSGLGAGQQAYALLADDYRRVQVVDRLGRSWAYGTTCYLYYDPYINAYIVLEGHEPEWVDPPPPPPPDPCEESSVPLD